MEPRNALLARRGAQILEEAAQLSSKRGSLEEQQQQKVLEAPALSIRICAARCHGRCCLVGAGSEDCPKRQHFGPWHSLGQLLARPHLNHPLLRNIFDIAICLPDYSILFYPILQS